MVNYTQYDIVISIISMILYDSVISTIQYDPVRYHQIIVFEACGGCTVVKLGTLNPKIEGSSPASDYTGGRT
jgi:hypothetical protein